MVATQHNLEKGMPASIDAEKTILGSILLDVSLYHEATEKLAPEHFHLDGHRRIFARMLELGESARPIDMITLSQVLSDHRELEAVGGIAYVSSLIDGVPHMPSVRSYIKIVRDKAILRGVINAANNAISLALENETAEDVVAVLEERLLELRTTGKSLQPFMSLMQAAAQDMDRLRAIPHGVMLGHSTSLDSLDHLTTGIRASELWVVGARPNVGKTPFAMQIALANAAEGVRVGIFSLEMSSLQLAYRCMAHAGCAPARKLRDPRRMDPEEYEQARERAGGIAEYPIWVDDTPNLSVRQLRAKFRLAVHKHGCQLGVIDYLQLLEAPGKDPYQRVSYATRAIRELVRETGVPIIALSQLNRNAKNPEHAPSLGDLRESGVIEQEANVVVLIHRPPEDDDVSVLANHGHFILAKMREGVCGPEPFEFDTRTLTFIQSQAWLKGSS